MTTDNVQFSDLSLPTPLLTSLNELGYETPSPIQAATIPSLLEGRDLIGQAQTGTGKTAAFALPLLAKIDYQQNHPQLLILTPTRELAIQVAEACQRYASHMKAKILPIYGGQSYTNQLKQLKRGVHIIVGTPGRVMDHINRKTLQLDKLQALVLDEADEMLRMGFIDDVEWILKRTPKERQIALFSATMPKVIQKVAEKYLNNPKHVKIANKTATANTIRQRYWSVGGGMHKLEALTRLLEVEEFDGVIIFVRTKIATVELADKIAARGHRCEALNGDIAQRQREQIVEKLKAGKVDILVATDVVARGLDVERISHVINYDIPLDIESYVHRIGRTGRAGREGDAILFVAPRERRLLKAIEKMTKSPMVEMNMPSTDEVNQQRVQGFKERITQVIEHKNLTQFTDLITAYLSETDHDPAIVAAALAAIAQGNTPLFFEESKAPKESRRRDRDSDRGSDRGRGRNSGERGDYKKKRNDKDGKRRPSSSDENLETYQIAIGHNDGVKPGNIVGAIANEADISSKYIGHIKIHDDYSTVDLPSGLSKDVLKKLQRTYVCGKQINLKRK